MRTTLQFDKTFVHLHCLHQFNGDHALVVYRKNVTIGSCVVKARNLNLSELLEVANHVLNINECYYPEVVRFARKELLMGKER